MHSSLLCISYSSVQCISVIVIFVIAHTECYILLLPSPPQYIYLPSFLFLARHKTTSLFFYLVGMRKYFFIWDSSYLLSQVVCNPRLLSDMIYVSHNPVKEYVYAAAFALCFKLLQFKFCKYLNVGLFIIVIG